MKINWQSIWGKATLTNICIYGIALVFVTVSAIQSANGYAPFFKNYSIGAAVAIAVSAGLFLYDHYLKEELEGTRSIGQLSKYLLIYTCIAFASFAGNFNAIFTNAVGHLPLIDQLNSVQADLSELASGMTTELAQKDPYLKIKKEVEALLPSLENEIVDEDEPGIGDVAYGVINQIEELLKVQINIPTTKESPVSIREAKRLYQQLEKTINGVLESKKNNSTNARVSAEIEEKTEAAQTQISAFLETEKAEEEARLAQQLKRSILAYNDLLAIGRSHQLDFAMTRTELKQEAAQIGQFDATLELLRSGDYPNQAITAAGQSLFLDFIVPIILLGTYRRRKKEDPKAEDDKPLVNMRLQLGELQKDVRRAIQGIQKQSVMDTPRKINGKSRQKRRKTTAHS